MHWKNLIRFVLNLGMAASLAIAASSQTGTPAIPAFDEFMNTIMKNYGIPGGAIAVSRNGRLLMARGYGMADKDNNIPVQADSLFRVASLSKLITSVTIMHLAEQGKLSVNKSAFALLPDLQAPPGTTEDPRLESITIANLLTHSGGWDINALGYDPMFYGQEIAAALHVASPASTENIIRYMRGQPLNFDPGTKYVYSNFGYAVLGRIIERVTGMSYEQYVRTNVLAPMGITDMRTGQTLSQGQLPNEVRYYSDGANGANIFPGAKPATVGLPYGTWYMEAMDSNGGWVASVIDYVKLMNSLEGRRGKAFLQPSSLAAMTARPPIAQYHGLNSWYGFGLAIVQEPAGQIWWHNGALDGTETYEIRTDNGFDWVVFFNKRQSNGDTLDSGIWSGLFQAAFETTSWPNVDYFTDYPDADPAQAATLPAITTREGVLNTASNDRGIVSGSWVTISGVNLSNTTRSWTPSDIQGIRLPMSLDGVSVKINGSPAAIFSISPTELQVQAPEGVGQGWVTVEVNNNGATTTPVLAQASEYAPGLFTQTIGGTVYAIATKSDGRQITPSNPALPGGVITLYATGLAGSQAGTVVSTPQAVPNIAVQIGDSVATVQYAGLIAAGLYQINVVVPDPGSGNQKVIVSSNYQPSQPNVMIALAENF
jgi:N-acyl-D-amino-acid deacylase